MKYLSGIHELKKGEITMETSVRYAERTAADFILLVPKNIPEKSIDKLVVDIFASELV